MTTTFMVHYEHPYKGYKRVAITVNTRSFYVYEPTAGDLLELVNKRPEIIEALPSGHSVVKIYQVNTHGRTTLYADDPLNTVDSDSPVYLIIKSVEDRIRNIALTAGIPIPTTRPLQEAVAKHKEAEAKLALYILKMVHGDGVPATFEPSSTLTTMLLRDTERILGLHVSKYSPTLFTILKKIEDRMPKEKRATGHQLLPRLEQAEKAFSGIHAGNRSILQRLWTLDNHVA